VDHQQNHAAAALPILVHQERWRAAAAAGIKSHLLFFFDDAIASPTLLPRTGAAAAAIS